MARERLRRRPTGPERQAIWAEIELMYCDIPDAKWRHELRNAEMDRRCEVRRPTIPPSLRKRVYERDGYACLHCKKTENLSLDHVIPYSEGGADTYENLQTLCLPCNMQKGAGRAVLPCR